MQNQTRRIHAEILMFFLMTREVCSFVCNFNVQTDQRVDVIHIEYVQYFYGGRVALGIGFVLTVFPCVEETNVGFSARQVVESRVEL